MLTKAKPYIAHYKMLPKIFEDLNSKNLAGEAHHQKGFTGKLVDYLYIFLILKMMPTNYQLFGLESKKRSEFKQYLGESGEPFTKLKMRKLRNNNIILRDKELFKIICMHHNLPVPRYYGRLKFGKIDGGKENTLALIDRHKPKKLVLKPTLGFSGVGVKFFNPERLDDILADEVLRKETYILEEAIEQHSDMNRINPFSINTIRLITFLCSDGSIELLSGVLKTSASKAPVDNFNLGGIIVGIDLETGKVKQNGYTRFYSPDFVVHNGHNTDKKTVQKILDDIKKIKKENPGRIFKQHPLTNFKFEGFQLPYWNEIIETAKRVQQVFSHSITNAIDMAITSRRPVILESNGDWGTTGVQAANGGLLTERNRKLFAQYGLKF
jgi:hypothetical protein